MPSAFFPVLLSVFFLWLATLSFLFWQMRSHYNNLTRGVTDRNLKSLLEDYLKESDSTKKDIAMLKEYCDRIEKEGSLHIQKIGLLRFNPFKDTGGDQSFIMALTDGNDSGVIISALYSRSGTRWYAKKVKMGKGVEHELSEEEKKALKEAATKH
ncbi:MAG TPA: DUF4446 family protein [Candidatus Saccharimonadales bacterium]|nr:DUF4446 family protein [Candidatus Saccharimonadales bacterium]